jgi:hypothetical protein
MLGCTCLDGAKAKDTAINKDGPFLIDQSDSRRCETEPIKAIFTPKAFAFIFFYKNLCLK